MKKVTFDTKEINSRKKIYTNFKKLNIKNVNQLFYYEKIHNFSDLTNAVNFYISENIRHYGKKNKYISLYKSVDEIYKLDNITPNGLILPTEKTNFAYNFLVKIIFQSLEKITPYIESAVPPLVRIKNSSKNLKNRPYSTYKMHSDAWVGLYGDAVISMGLDGDLENNGVEFNLPNKTSKDFFKKINDYDEGANKYLSAKKIRVLKKGEWVLLDHAVLHKSVQQKKFKPRLSIDFGIKLKHEYKKKILGGGDKKRFHYHNIKDYLNLGTDTFIKTTRKIVKKDIITTHEFIKLKK